MTSYHLLIISSIKNTFSLIDAGNDFLYRYQYKEREESFKDLEVGDKILGYLRNPFYEIRYVFGIKDLIDSNTIILEKELEVSKGVSLDSLNDDIQESIQKSGGELFEISESQYNKITNELWGTETTLEPELDPDPPQELTHYDIDRVITAPEIPLPYNYIVFGAPGTGKSNTLKKKQEKYFKHENTFERVTFYPNYTYQNFVGTYKPKMDGRDIVYEYIPGPFIKTLVKAYKETDKNHLLLIEEINRVNPAAVFGDIFQLLDREGGKSVYSIDASEDLKEYLASELIPGYRESSNINSRESVKNSFNKIFIPSNMYIWATMNSADQGVFPMDTAFKRRWDFKYIGINESSEDIKDIMVKLGKDEHDVNWNRLRIAINNKLSQNCRINEDKLLGPYFLSKDTIENNEETNYVIDNSKFIDAFKSKVLMYLYEDAAKQHRQKIFEGCEDVSKYSSICETFDIIGEGIFGEDVKKDAKENVSAGE